MLQTIGVLMLSAVALIFVSGLAWLIILRLREQRVK